MDCPKCGFSSENRVADCPACGIVFAKFRPDPQPAAPADRTPPAGLAPAGGAVAREPLDALDANGFDKQPVVSLGIGAALALWTLNSPLLYTLSHMLKTLVHELGHAIAGWGFGVPSVPAFDFTYGGGVTIHRDPSAFALALIYAAWVYLLFVYRRKASMLIPLGAIGVAHIASIASGLDEPITLAMGHGFELLFAGIFFYRALSGFACVHAVERPLYAFLGFLISFDDMRFAHRLIYSHEHRWMYENAKGGSHWMDFDRLAREFLFVDLSTIAYGFLLASAAPLVISLALYCARDRWVPRLGRLLSPSPEA